MAGDTSPGPIRVDGTWADRTVGRERKREEGPLFCYLSFENVYVSVAKTVQRAQILNDLDVSAAGKGHKVWRGPCDMGM